MEDDYRFTFETEDQYQARLQQEAASESVATEPLPGAAQGGKPVSLLLPWWIVVPVVLVVLAVGYRSHRQKLIRQGLERSPGGQPFHVRTRRVRGSGRTQVVMRLQPRNK
ncbi:MAG: hypothetical protein HYZ09_00990 [Candidatus Kerfeldbacteria bacterium]|nr:hypothetical protein [Candidatus Kerfeldbacteria bacterium]